MNEKSDPRYILINLDSRNNENLAYLYDYAKVIDRVGTTGIVEIITDDSAWNARYQLNRLWSGWNVACTDGIYNTPEEAKRVAEAHEKE